MNLSIESNNIEHLKLIICEKEDEIKRLEGHAAEMQNYIDTIERELDGSAIPVSKKVPSRSSS